MVPGPAQQRAQQSLLKSPRLYSGQPGAGKVPYPPPSFCRIPVTVHAAILDTNVVLDCFVFRNPACQALVDTLEAGLIWLSTPAMRAELLHVLGRGVGERWAVPAAQVLARFDHHARLEAEPPPSRLVCSDASDQIFIDLAVARRALLLTRDRALLKLARRAALCGAAVLTPERWSFVG
jgi:predicted nucleic acid-binding protein